VDAYLCTDGKPAKTGLEYYKKTGVQTSSLYKSPEEHYVDYFQNRDPRMKMTEEGFGSPDVEKRDSTRKYKDCYTEGPWFMKRGKNYYMLYAAGVKRGDKIIQVNNEQITSASHLINYVALQAPQSVIDVVIERDGKQQSMQVKVGERKTQQNAQSQYIPLPKPQD
jgi:hypothetical protein